MATRWGSRDDGQRTASAPGGGSATREHGVVQDSAGSTRISIVGTSVKSKTALGHGGLGSLERRRGNRRYGWCSRQDSARHTVGSDQDCSQSRPRSRFTIQRLGVRLRGRPVHARGNVRP